MDSILMDDMFFEILSYSSGEDVYRWLSVSKSWLKAGLLALPRITHLTCNEKTPDSAVSTLTNLTSLDVGENNIVTDDSIRCLQNLQHLNIQYNLNITDKSISLLKNLTSLRIYKAFNITYASISLLTNLQSLKIFRRVLSCSTPLIHLTKLRCLKLLDIDIEGYNYLRMKETSGKFKNRHVTNSCISELTNLRNLKIHHTFLMDSSFPKLVNLTKLDIIGRNRYISDNSLIGLVNLITLKISFNSSINGESFSSFPGLIELQLKYTSIQDIHLASLQNLKKLVIKGDDTISDNSVSALTSLIYLNLEQTHITAQAVQHLTNLSQLILYHPGEIRVPKCCYSHIEGITVTIHPKRRIPWDYGLTDTCVF